MRRSCRSYGERSAAPRLQLRPNADTVSASFVILFLTSSVARSISHSHPAAFAADLTFLSRPRATGTTASSSSGHKAGAGLGRRKLRARCQARQLEAKVGHDVSA